MSDEAASEQMPGSGVACATTANLCTSAAGASSIFGANFKRVRKVLGLSRNQAAESLGLADDHLAKIEAGVGGQVKFDLIVRMTKTMNINVKDLLVGID